MVWEEWLGILWSFEVPCSVLSSWLLPSCREKLAWLLLLVDFVSFLHGTSGIFKNVYPLLAKLSRLFEI